MFRCSLKFSAGTIQKVVFHLLSNRIFQKRFVNGKSNLFLCCRIHSRKSKQAVVSRRLSYHFLPCFDHVQLYPGREKGSRILSQYTTMGIIVW